MNGPFFLRVITKCLFYINNSTQIDRIKILSSSSTLACRHNSVYGILLIALYNRMNRIFR